MASHSSVNNPSSRHRRAFMYDVSPGIATSGAEGSARTPAGAAGDETVAAIVTSATDAVADPADVPRRASGGDGQDLHDGYNSHDGIAYAEPEYIEPEYSGFDDTDSEYAAFEFGDAEPPTLQWALDAAAERDRADLTSAANADLGGFDGSVTAGIRALRLCDPTQLAAAGHGRAVLDGIVAAQRIIAHLQAVQQRWIAAFARPGVAVPLDATIDAAGTSLAASFGAQLPTTCTFLSLKRRERESRVRFPLHVRRHLRLRQRLRQRQAPRDLPSRAPAPRQLSPTTRRPSRHAAVPDTTPVQTQRGS